MKIDNCFKSLLLCCMAVCGGAASADASEADTIAARTPYEINWEAGLTANAGSGNFAPYYIASNRHGTLTQNTNVLARVSAWRDMETEKRFSYGFGADLIGGYGSSIDYMRWSDDRWVVNPQHPSRFWIQQLYGEIKYRSVFLSVGLKQHTSALLDFNLSSGDLVESGNARPIPQARIGFIDFQDIPFTNGWVQIQGEISYGVPTGDAWVRDHYNYYNQHINQGALFTYKRCYFRTKPSKPLSLTIGMQCAGFFGGDTEWFLHGRYNGSRHMSKSFEQFFRMLIPKDGGAEYVSGSSLGSVDILLRYRFRNGMTLRGYLQKPWEDGSSMGFLNGFDGLWGLEFKTGRGGFVSGAVVEYLDFTNQSGPIHWSPDDHPGSDLHHRAQGADDYYNNHEYNSYQNYGMSIGTPFLRSTLYNLDGCIEYLNNRVRGFHIGVEGELTADIDYRLLGGYRKSWGSGYVPLVVPLTDTSVMVEASYRIPRVKGLTLKGQIGYDHGTLYGDNFGACVSVTYKGLLKL